MERLEFKLKQASAALGVPPKDLQNLVQLNVIRPLRRSGLNWFDTRCLLQAKVVFYIRDALGSSSEVLSRFAEALSRELKNGGLTAPYVLVRSRPRSGDEAVEIKIPLRALAKELEERLPLAASYQDLPKGRKRPGWKRDMLSSFSRAASDIGNVSMARVREAICQYRKERKGPPEIRIANSKRKTA